MFAELGWAVVSALEETSGAPSPGLAAQVESLTRPSATLSHPVGEGQVGEGASLGRETKGEVVLVSRLRAALQRLNPTLPPEAIAAASISGIWPFSPGGEMACFSEIPVENGRQGSGHTDLTDT